MGIILVSLTENMMSTANLERLHGMCQPSTMTLQSRASFQFSGLARKIFLPLPCLTLGTTELSRTRSANICTAPSLSGRSCQSVRFHAQRLPALTALPNAPYERQAHFFFTVITHWKQYSVHIPWAVMTASKKELGFQKTVFSSVMLRTAESLPHHCSCSCRNAMCTTDILNRDDW